MRDSTFTRRSLLGSAGATLLGPLAGGARANPSGQPAVEDAPVTAPAFEVLVELDASPNATTPVLAASGVRLVHGGRVQGALLSGLVRSGHLRWRTDTALDTVELLTEFVVQRDDGSVVEVRDRSVHELAASSAQLERLPSATTLHFADGQDGLPVILVGRLDASHLSSGSLRLNAFRVA